MNLTQKIELLLKTEFESAYIQVSDPYNDGAHLEAVVVSDDFIDKSLVQQQRLVLKSLKSEFETVLHALKLKTYTFKQWNEKQELSQ